MMASLRSTLRGWRRSPAFVFTVVATLAIGIGLNAAIFTVVDCVVLQPLGYHDANRIVALQTRFLDESRSIPRLGDGDYSDLSRGVKGLEATAYYWGGLYGVELAGNALYLPIAGVSPQFTQVMGAQPVAGRSFRPGSADASGALVSASFAREQFGSPQAALGKGIHSFGALHTIVGVMPDGFSFPGKTAVWFDLGPTPEGTSRTAYNQQAVGKRRRGVSSAQLAEELATFSTRLQHAFPEDREKAIEAVPLQEQITGNIRPTLQLLMGSVAVVLLIVLANITHLQLVRATREMRATTIRSALGASRAALAFNALLGAALLAAAGCAGALVLAAPALKLLLRIAPADTPRLGEVHLNFEVLLLSFVASLLLMSLTAVLPVWRSWHVDPAFALKQNAARGMESRDSHRLRNGLLAAEIALTLTLSVAAVTLARQLVAQSRQDLGFSAENLITLDSHFVETASAPVLKQAATPGEKAAAEAAREAFNQKRLARLNAALTTIASVPDVASVTAADGAPMASKLTDVDYAVRGRQVFAPGVQHLPNADVNAISPSFFHTLRIPLLRGRGFSPADRSGTLPILLISQSLARTVFPHEDPLGRQVMCGLDETAGWWTIVGVVGDVRDRSPAAAPRPTMYLPVAQHAERATDMQIIVRSRGNAAAMGDILRRQLKHADPGIAIEGTSMRANIAGAEQADRFRTVLFASFAGVSILLAGVGLYGVTAYTVAQRRFEFGVRLALGASPGQMLRLVLRNAAKVTGVGIAVGVALSFAATRVLDSVVGKLPGFDGPAFFFAALGVLLLALLAAFLPARAAAAVDPMEVLRAE